MGCIDKAILFLDSFGYIHKITNGGSVDALDLIELIKSIFIEYDQCYAIALDGNLFEVNYKKSRITRINNIQKVKFVSIGKLFLIVICLDDTVWSKGDNWCGQLGLGDYEHRENFTQIETNELITFISCGDAYSLFLTESRKVFSCGNDNPEFKEKCKGINVLQQIKGLGLIQMIACSCSISLFVDMDGNLLLGENTTYEANYFGEFRRINIPPVHYLTKSKSLVVVMDINGDVWTMETVLGVSRLVSKEIESPTRNFTKLNFDRSFSNNNDYKTMTVNDLLFQIEAFEEEQKKNVCNTLTFLFQYFYISF